MPGNDDVVGASPVLGGEGRQGKGRGPSVAAGSAASTGEASHVTEARRGDGDASNAAPLRGTVKGTSGGRAGGDEKAGGFSTGRADDIVVTCDDGGDCISNDAPGNRDELGRLGELTVTGPRRRIFPLFDPACSGRVFSRGEVGCNSVEIVIEEKLLSRLLDEASQVRDRETAGVLVGEYYAYNTIEFVTIEAFVPADHTRSAALSVGFTHESWAGIRREMELRHPGRRIVGWYHTHPRSGVYFSGRDVFAHRNFFAPHWQVAMVIDPNDRSFSFFQRAADCDEIVPCGYYFLCDGLAIG